jgi:hypothetical protein
MHSVISSTSERRETRCWKLLELRGDSGTRSDTAGRSSSFPLGGTRRLPEGDGESVRAQHRGRGKAEEAYVASTSLVRNGWCDERSVSSTCCTRFELSRRRELAFCAPEDARGRVSESWLVEQSRGHRDVDKEGRGDATRTMIQMRLRIHRVVVTSRCVHNTLCGKEIVNAQR